MKVTNRTAYATIGCDVQLSENDRLTLGIELDKVTNWLETVIGDKAITEDPYKAINNLVAFISKFAISPSQSNVFTASPEEFKKTEDTHLLADKTKTAVESIPEDNAITVDITSAKTTNMINLAKIIYHATDASLGDISELINSAKERNISNISFKCTDESKIETAGKLVSAGYIIEPNTTESLKLETYMLSH